jgi:hypothetical protein
MEMGTSPHRLDDLPAFKKTGVLLLMATKPDLHTLATGVYDLLRLG